MDCFIIIIHLFALNPRENEFIVSVLCLKNTSVMTKFPVKLGESRGSGNPWPGLYCSVV